MTVTNNARGNRRRSGLARSRDGGPSGKRAVGSGRRLAFHSADDAPAIGDQHLSLIWAIRLSFTGLMANLPNPAQFIGIDNYVDILTDEDLWANFQITAHFVFWTILLQVLIGLGLALLINQKFRGHSFWTTVILLPMCCPPRS